MSASFHVRVEKDYLVFSAAHFITLSENVCERLHGHNYRVAAEVFGSLNNEQMVIDFIVLRDAMRDLISELDHRVILPTQHPKIRVATTGDSIEATFDDRRWVFPHGDCALLPVTNTTAERLAEYLARRLVAELANKLGAKPARLRVEVDECYGQIGVCELAGD
jgi:6-pyruvoyltetrahydropterin/6-carboxytetrahydropterin synthase